MAMKRRTFLLDQKAEEHLVKLALETEKNNSDAVRYAIKVALDRVLWLKQEEEKDEMVKTGQKEGV